MSKGVNFASLAKQLEIATRTSTDCGRRVLQNRAPEIVAQIRHDAQRRGPLSFWGRSRNVDELTGATIVAPGILQLIADLAGRSLSTTTPHAGLQHTYGYLFSTIETPYGFKRERWLETEIEDAFGLHSTTMGPAPLHGTLLTNATWFCGQIAFRRDRLRLQRLQRFLQHKVSPDLLTRNAALTGHTCLVEKAAVSWRQIRRTWTLQTDLLPFPDNPDRAVLVYSIVDHHRNTHQLITLFTVTRAVREELQARAASRRRRDIRTRYNAWVSALHGRLLSGTCRVE